MGQRRSSIRSYALGAAALLGTILAPSWGEAQSVNPVRWDEPEALTVVSVPVVIVDAEIIETPTSNSMEQVSIPRSTIVDYCGDGDGCKLRLLAIGSQAEIRPAWFAIVGSDDWTLKRLDGTTHSGKLTDFIDDHILVAQGSDEGVQQCAFGEFTESGFPFSTLTFTLTSQSTTVHAHRCVLHIED